MALDEQIRNNGAEWDYCAAATALALPSSSVDKVISVNARPAATRSVFGSSSQLKTWTLYWLKNHALT